MLTESELRNQVGATIFARGESYLTEDAVESVARKGPVLTALVQGTQYKPYRVTVVFDAQGSVEEADCTCPYSEEYGGWCKHIVAALLHQLQGKEPTTALPTPAGVNAHAIEQEVRSVFRFVDEDPYEEDSSPIQELLDEYTQQAQTYFVQGNSDTALVLLETFLSSFLAGCQGAEYECDFDALSAVIGAGVLRGGLSTKQRQDWIKHLRAWEKKLGDYDEDELQVAREILQHESNNLDHLKSEARETTGVRLAWLEEQQKWSEALLLATLTNWESKRARYLIALGRQEEAEPILQASAKDVLADEAVVLVEALSTSDPVRALRVGRLLLPYRLVPNEQGYADYEYQEGEPLVRELLQLVRQLAEAQHVTAGIAEAVAAQVLVEPTLAHWKECAALATPDEQARLLQRLASARRITRALLEVLLANQCWSEAWNAAQRCYESGVRLETARQVVAHLPEPIWSYARSVANPFIENNKSAHYETAALWLARERDADIALGQGKRWNERLTLLRQQNARKYKLMPLLNALSLAPEDETPPPPPTTPTERKPWIIKVSRS